MSADAQLSSPYELDMIELEIGGREDAWKDVDESRSAQHLASQALRCRLADGERTVLELGRDGNDHPTIPSHHTRRENPSIASCGHPGVVHNQILFTACPSMDLKRACCEQISGVGA